MLLALGGLWSEIALKMRDGHLLQSVTRAFATLFSCSFPSIRSFKLGIMLWGLSLMKLLMNNYYYTLLFSTLSLFLVSCLSPVCYHFVCHSLEISARIKWLWNFSGAGH